VANESPKAGGWGPIIMLRRSFSCVCAAAFDAATDAIMWTSVFYLGFLRSTQIGAVLVLMLEWTLTLKIVWSIIAGRVFDWFVNSLEF
jgi:hypothetical protein